MESANLNVVTERQTSRNEIISKELIKTKRFGQKNLDGKLIGARFLVLSFQIVIKGTILNNLPNLKSVTEHQTSRNEIISREPIKTQCFGRKNLDGKVRRI